MPHKIRLKTTLSRHGQKSTSTEGNKDPKDRGEHGPGSLLSVGLVALVVALPILNHLCFLTVIHWASLSKCSPNSALKILLRDMRVNLSRTDIGVPKKFLHLSNVGAAFKQSCCG